MIDVCFILEGTYPYVTGGVSAWVQTLLTGLPEITFGLIHLSATDGPPREARYPRPANLRQMVEWPLDIEPEGVGATLSRSIPPARLYHALSTGFAGMLGCQLKAATGRPLILTEHGIYWREIEAGADELECGFRLVSDDANQVNLKPLRHHWRITLQDMAREAYQQADAITTVCQVNFALQTQLGAPPERCQVIPNSVSRQRLAPTAPRQPAEDRPQQIGFIGRVVRIKDLLTFIRACQRVAEALPDAQFYMIGPLDHDPTYVAQCRALVAETGLTDRLTFTGEVDPTLWYHRLDLVVLTSVSEGQPLVLLEAMAAGVPVVTTEVGGCPDLIRGATPEDRALGEAGLLTPVADPTGTAQAILTLCRDSERWRAASKAGQRRTERFYSTEQLCGAYRSLYQWWLPI